MKLELFFLLQIKKIRCLSPFCCQKDRSILYNLGRVIVLCYDIKPVRKEEGKSYWKIPFCDDDATREK